MIIAFEFMLLLIFHMTCFSDGLVDNQELQICKQKLVKERNLHKSDKSRLKQHLKNTRHNIRVYQRMLQETVRIKYFGHKANEFLHLKILLNLKLLISASSF